MNFYQILCRRAFRVMVLLVLVIPGALPTAADNYTPVFPIFNVLEASCDNGFSFNAAASNPYPQQLGFRSFVDSGGLRYTDQIVLSGANYQVVNVAGIISVETGNDGGTATANWPIPAGQEVFVTVQILRDNIYPISESRVTLDSCNGNVIASESGAIGHLINNIGFETAGTLPTLAAQWETSIDNDNRLCNDEVPGTAHSGNCAFNMKPGAVKNKLSQSSLLDSIARNGDQIRLGAWVKAGNLGTGSSIILKIKFPTLDKIKQKIDLPVGTYDYQLVSSPPINIIETPTKLTVSIQAKGAGGSFVIDDVMADVAVGAAPLPVVRAAATSGIIALPGGTQATDTLNGVDLMRPVLR
jgi:hypothetical protein